MTLFSDVQRRQLPNGLEILVREDHSAPVVALNFFVRVGSLNEDDTIAGWSHGIEHMLFKGTQRRGPGDIAREISNAGGETNAGTGYESTNYYIVVPSRNFEVALDIHADVLQWSVFDEYELEKERQVLIKENEMYRDRPSGFGFTWEGLLAEAFTTHRYKRPIGGPDENLLRVGRDPILAYKETYYVPNNITYVVVGDVAAEDVFRAMEEKLGGWPRRDLVPDISPPEPHQTGLRYREIQGDVERSYVKIGFHIPPELDADTDALMVLSHVLASGRSSRLYQRVREEKALILGAHIMETTGREPGYLVVEFEAEPEKRDEALIEVMREILGMQTEPVTGEELARTLRAVRNDTLYTLETMEGQARMLGHYALLGDYRMAGTYLDRISRVTPAAILDAARRYLGPDQATVFAYGPRDRELLAPDAAALRRKLETAVSAVREPETVSASAEPARVVLPAGTGRDVPDPRMITLDSGTRVILQPDGRLPLVALSAYLPTGSGQESEGLAGVTRLTQTTMLKGAGGVSAQDLAGRLDRMGARLLPFSRRDVSGFRLGVVREDLDPALDLFSTVLTRPDFPRDAVDKEKHRTLAELAALRDHTLDYTVTEFFRLLFPGHAYGRPGPGLEASVSGLNRDHLAARHREMYDPSRMVVGVAGDFEEKEILAALEKLVSGLPRTGDAPGTAPVTPIGEPIRRDLEQEVSQSVVVLGYPGPKIDSEDRYALDVWNGILSGMGNRLFTSLRDEQHLCYFTGSFIAPFVHGGAIGAYVGTGADQVEAARDALLAELERSTRETPTPEELLRAKNTLAGSYWIDMQTRMAWASTYAQDEILGLGYEETHRYLERIQAVSAEETVAAAARYIRDSRLAVAVLRPSGDTVSREQTVSA